MIDLGKLLDIDEFDKFIEIAETLPIIPYVYGGYNPVPDYPCWTKANGVAGTISFSKNIHKCDALAGAVSRMHDALLPFFPSPPLAERMHFIKTTGSIGAHIDEGGRASCINIGLRNSSSAITRVGKTNELSLFNTEYDDYVVKEGHGYLLNTSQYHSVIGSPDIIRYQISYKFQVDGNKIQEWLIMPKISL